MPDAEHKRDVLVTLADEAYLDAAKQLFSSVYFNSGWQGDYLLLAYGVAEEKLTWFTDRGIYVYRCAPLVEFTYGKWPVSMLSFLYLFDVYFKQWRKILYLDSDIIVRASLDRILRGSGVRSAPLLFFKKVTLQRTLLPHYRNNRSILCGHSLRHRVFIVGVNCIDTTIITEETLGELKKFLSYNFASSTPEELALSFFFCRRWKILSAFYNMAPTRIIKKCRLRPEQVNGPVLHFQGTYKKPWQAGNYFYEEWKSNLDRADDIDLVRRPPPKKVWRSWEIYWYLAYLWLRKIFFTFRS